MIQIVFIVLRSISIVHKCGKVKETILTKCVKLINSKHLQYIYIYIVIHEKFYEDSIYSFESFLFLFTHVSETFKFQLFQIL